ncbi:MAG TPA: DUF502 domain-containing protein [Kiloniellales bacterium]|nr:DUF502 domain-containing protein [Kiloniellales bacterium]
MPEEQRTPASAGREDASGEGRPLTLPKPGRMRLGTRLRTYFFAGILVTAPVGITFWLTWKVIAFVDDRVTPLIPPAWNPANYLPFGLPGFGLIIAAVFLTLVGFLAAGYAGRLVMRASERVVNSVPVARSIYTWTKQVFETVLSQKGTAFNEVVLIEYPSRGVWAIGFITGRTEGEVQDMTEATVYNVFVPATPNPTTGFLLFIPEADIQHLDMTVEEGIKLVISGGIVEPPKRVPGAETPANGRTRRARHPAEDPVALVNGHTSHGHAGHGHGGVRQPLGFLRRLRNYFFAGILVTAPISITIWLTWTLISFVDDRVMPFIPARWNPETYLPFSLPGLGLVLAVVALMIVGFITAGLVGRTLVGLGERLLDRMPVIRSVYGAVKQIFETVLREQSKAFRQVALLQYPREGSWALGFVTGETEAHVQSGTPRRVTNVFLPTTPNPTSGFLLFVPREDLEILSMTVEEGIKMIVSGGIVTPPDRRAALAAAAAEEGGPPETPELARRA